MKPIKRGLKDRANRSTGQVACGFFKSCNAVLTVNNSY